MSIEVGKKYNENSETGLLMTPHLADSSRSRDMDKMLAQLVFLDTTLEEQKKEKRRIRKRQKKIKSSAGNLDGTKQAQPVDDDRLSLSDCECDVIDQVNSARSRSSLAMKNTAESSKKRERRRKRGSECDFEEALRRRLSSISVDSSDDNCDVTKKRIAHINGGSANEVARNQSDKSEGNCVIEDGLVENSDLKCDPNNRRALVKSCADGDAGNDETAATADSEQLAEVEKKRVSRKHLKKMEKLRKKSEAAGKEVPCRVIVVDNPRRKKQKSKSNKTENGENLNKAAGKDEKQTKPSKKVKNLGDRFYQRQNSDNRFHKYYHEVRQKKISSLEENKNSVSRTKQDDNESKHSQKYGVIPHESAQKTKEAHSIAKLFAHRYSDTPPTSATHIRSSRAARKDEQIKNTSGERTVRYKKQSRKSSKPAEESNCKLAKAVFTADLAKIYETSDTIRPDLRRSKSGNKGKQSFSPLKHVRAGDPEIESESSSYSTSSTSSRVSGLSSYSQSSNDQSSADEPISYRRRYVDKHNNNKSRSSSDETNIKRDLTTSNVTDLPRDRHRQQRSASSTSSFLRYPFRLIDAKVKTKNKYNSNEGGKRLENMMAVGGNKQDEGSPPPSPNDNVFEPKFGRRRTKRPNICVVAEGEDGHSRWQHQHLVVVSQKPDRKMGPQRSNQAKQQGIISSSSGGDNRPQTIRDLYSLHNVLSDTQNGTVISGYRRSDGMRVAIKRISKVGTSRWGKMKSKTVPLELALLCQVNEARCRGVVQIVEWHETIEAYLLVMVRPHPAVDLYDYLSKHKVVKESLARVIVQQLVTSLLGCIGAGVLHRDVKLENILLNPETMETTLIDFGCGDYVRSGPYKEFAGTPEYYAPEWFTRRQYSTDPMTAWSVGVLLYSLLCGAMPFRSAKEIREKDANKFPSDVSRSARELVGLLLQRNPKERLSINEILDHPWFNKSS